MFLRCRPRVVRIDGANRHRGGSWFPDCERRPRQITPQDPATVQSAIVAAAKAGRTSIVIPPGIYRIPREAVRAGHEAHICGLKTSRIWRFRPRERR